MPLTNIQIKALTPKEKVYRLFDGEGLYIEVHPNGRKYWGLKYRDNGKERRAGLGTYPDTSLAEARKKRDERKGRSGKPKTITLEAAAREWLAAQGVMWSVKYKATVTYRVETHILPTLGHRDIRGITAQVILTAIDPIEKTPVMAKCVLQYMQAIFGRQMILGGVDANPAAGLQRLIIAPATKHNPKLSEKELAVFLKKMRGHTFHPITKCAMRFLLLTIVRTGEMRFATWQEADIKKAEWRIPASRMKMDRDHIVPLSRQAVECLKDAAIYSKGMSHIFLSPYNVSKPISENAVLYAIYDMGYKGKLTGHGFRATASTILNEHGFRSDVIERQLAHVEGNKVRAAYNHAEYLNERREMLQWWADFLDSLESQKTS